VTPLVWDETYSKEIAFAPARPETVRTRMGLAE